MFNLSIDLKRILKLINMKIIKTTFTIIALLVLSSSVTKAQPIPIELMMGNKYGVVDLAFSKKFSSTSRLGFFHMNTIQFDYNEDFKNSLILQDLLFVETNKKPVCVS